MSLYQSPGIVSSGLVFAYDMQNPKSWQGEPIVNQFTCPDPYDTNNNVSFSVQGTGTFQRVYSGTYGGYTIQPNDVVYRYNLGSGGCHYHGNSSAIGSGQYVCFSVDYYISPDASDYVTNGTLIILENYGGSALGGGQGVSSSTSVMGTWQTIQGYSGPTGGTGTQAMFLYPGGCSGAGSYIASRGFILMKNPMFEFRSNVKYNPFVKGTRSNTQAIKDLTNNNTITANNLTYNNDNTFSFNNTATSALSIPNSSALQPTSVTISAWVLLLAYNPLNDFDGTYPTIIWKCYDNNSGANASYGLSLYAGGVPRFTVSPTQLISSTALAVGSWVHLTGVYSAGGTLSLYRNGVLDTSMSGGAASISHSSQPLAVGTRIFNSTYQYPWNGYVSNASVYNRALSASEIQQNFNALRRKYGV